MIPSQLLNQTIGPNLLNETLLMSLIWGGLVHGMKFYFDKLVTAAIEVQLLQNTLAALIAGNLRSQRDRTPFSGKEMGRGCLSFRFGVVSQSLKFLS
jgi:hypothetical protein